MIWEWVVVDVGARDGLVVDEVMNGVFKEIAMIDCVAMALDKGSIL